MITISTFTTFNVQNSKRFKNCTSYVMISFQTLPLLPMTHLKHKFARNKQNYITVHVP